MADNSHIISSPAHNALVDIMTLNAVTSGGTIDERINRFRRVITDSGRYSEAEIKALCNPVEDLVNNDVIIRGAEQQFQDQCKTLELTDFIAAKIQEGIATLRKQGLNPDQHSIAKYVLRAWVDSTPWLKKLKDEFNQAIHLFTELLTKIESSKINPKISTQITLSPREEYAINRICQHFEEQLGNLFDYRILKNPGGTSVIRLFSTIQDADHVHKFDRALQESIGWSLTNAFKLDVFKGFNATNETYSISMDFPLSTIVEYT